MFRALVDGFLGSPYERAVARHVAARTLDEICRLRVDEIETRYARGGDHRAFDAVGPDGRSYHVKVDLLESEPDYLHLAVSADAGWLKSQSVTAIVKRR